MIQSFNPAYKADILNSDTLSISLSYLEAGELLSIFSAFPSAVITAALKEQFRTTDFTPFRKEELISYVELIYKIRSVSRKEFQQLARLFREKVDPTRLRALAPLPSTSVMEAQFQMHQPHLLGESFLALTKQIIGLFISSLEDKITSILITNG